MTLTYLYWTDISSVNALETVLNDINIDSGSVSISLADNDYSHRILSISPNAALSSLKSIQSQDIHMMMCCDDNSKPGLYALLNSLILNHNFTSNQYLYFHILVENDHPIYEKEFETLFQHFLDNDTYLIKYEFKSFSDHKDAYTFFDEYRREHNDATKHVADIKHVFHTMNYARFYLPEIFPTISHYAIYIDVDTIVLHDIALLYFKNHSNCALRGVFEKAAYASMYNTDDIAGLSALGFNVTDIEQFESKMGFNAGMVLYDLNHWRMNNLTTKYERIMKYNQKQDTDIFKLGTQPIMNALYKDIEWECVLTRWWNTMGLGCDRISDTSWRRIWHHAHILHWTGKHKPWVKCANDKMCKFVRKEFWRKFLPTKFNQTFIENWNDEWDFVA